MKIRIELEIDMGTGAYDVRFNNVSKPGSDIDLTALTQVVHRVLEQVRDRSVGAAEPVAELMARRSAWN